MALTSPASSTSSARRPSPSSSGFRSGRLVAHVLVFELFAVAPLVPWWADFQSRYEIALIFSFVTLCVVGAALGTYRGLRPLILIASVFPYCWLAVPASYQIAYRVAAWQDGTVTSQVGATEKALLICCCFQLLLLVGYVTPRRTGPRALATPAEMSAAQLTLLRRASTYTLVAAALLLPVVVSIVGGLGALFATRTGLNDTIASAGYTAANTGIYTIVKLLPGQLCIVAALACVYALRAAGPLSPAQVSTLRFKLFLSLVLLAIYANPYTHTRFIFLAAFGSVALMLLSTRGWRTGIVALLVCLVAFLFAYPAANYFRSGEDHRLSLTQSFRTSDFDGFQQVINTVTLVDARGHAQGSHVVSAALFFVPRSIWSDKAIPASFEVASARGYVFQNLSLPIEAEFYLDLGWIGLGLVSYAWGLVWRRLDGAWRSRQPAVMIASYLAIAQIGIFRGPLGSLAPTYGIALILLLGLLIAFRNRSHRSAGNSLA